METKQQTDETVGTPLNGEQTETTLQGDEGNKPIQEETILSPSEVRETELSLKNRLRNWIKNNLDSKQIVNLIVALTATIIGGLIVFFVTRVATNRVIHYRCYSRPYITFESDYTQVFRLSDTVLYLEYSIGESKWKKLGSQNVVFGGNLGKLLLRGQNKKGSDGANITFATDAQVICTGDICTLIDYKNYNQADTKEATFSHLFEGCTQLVVAPELTPKVLFAGCYESMFSDCTSLKTAPELPATELAAGCYESMLSGCTSLKTAPELPATKLAEGCYEGMFSGCTSLETASELPATELASACYYRMFRDCTSLRQAPVLPATELARTCYRSMFNGCSSLEKAPKLPATELAEGCYIGMFEDCTSLNWVSDLPARELANFCYFGMFSGCSSLSEITILAIDINASFSLTDWLSNTSPTGTFYKSKKANWSNDGIVPPGWKVVLVYP